MAKTKTDPANVEVEDLEDIEAEDNDEEETEDEAQGIRPKDLAEELEVSPKTLRAYLRRQFPRASTEKNTSWLLDEDTADAVRAHFLGEDDEVEDDTESDEDEA